MSREFAIVALLVGLVIILSSSAACTLTPQPTPTPPTSTQVGEVELVRSARGGMLYRREADGAVFEEISYSFSGTGRGITDVFPVREGYLCGSIKIDGMDPYDSYEVWLRNPNAIGPYSDPDHPRGWSLYQEGFGGLNSGFCYPVYDGSANGRSGQVDPYYGGHGAGNWSWKVNVPSKANWTLRVCTRSKQVLDEQVGIRCE